MLNDIRVIAFDADDTLWDNEPYFKRAEADMCEVLAPFVPSEVASERLFETEMKNLADYGYGAVAFTMSLIENAITVSGGQVPAEGIMRIIEAGRRIMRQPATPLPGVRETLQVLHDTGRYRLVIFTKGELLTQQNKLKRSGLRPFFDKVFIMSDKQDDDYRELCQTLGIRPEQLLMVGNSLRSDILPALNIGAYAIHIPYAIMWQHEVIEDFEHEHLIRIKTFSEICQTIHSTARS